MRIAIALAVVLSGTAATWLTVETRRNRLVWDHFDVVKPGILYRSGQLNGDQLVDAVGRLGIRTVVNFQIPGEGVDYERAIAKSLGIDFMNLPMPGDGFGEEAQFREVLAACDDPGRRPVLIHCARGTCRTGAAVALYRYERDGWTVDDVSAEMRRQSYKDGWLPGYVYAMAKNKPDRDLYEPKVARDRNLPETPKARAPVVAEGGTEGADACPLNPARSPPAPRSGSGPTSPTMSRRRSGHPAWSGRSSRWPSASS